MVNHILVDDLEFAQKVIMDSILYVQDKSMEAIIKAKIIKNKGSGKLELDLKFSHLATHNCDDCDSTHD